MEDTKYKINSDTEPVEHVLDLSLARNYRWQTIFERITINYVVYLGTGEIFAAFLNLRNKHCSVEFRYIQNEFGCRPCRTCSGLFSIGWNCRWQSHFLKEFN
jgi:hypothetical protein